MSDLNSAIQFIRQGQKQEAQKILEPLLEANPTNIQAWFWYVETYPSREKRIKVLEICLKMNPGNSQIIQALQTLSNQRPEQTTFTPSPAPSPKPAVTPTRTPYSSLYDEEPKSSVTASTHSYFDEKPAYPHVATANTGHSSPGKQKNAWEEVDSYADTSSLSKPQATAKSYAFYDVWLTVLTSFDMASYEDILNDPEAGAGRGFEWVAYAGIISGLLAPLSLISNPQFTELRNMPEFNGLFGNMGTTALMVVMAFALALLTPLISVIGVAISAGVQNVLALFFGGNGHYGRTVYALAAYIAPITILIALLGIIPFVGQCLTSIIGLYNIVLNVRALRAAHSISIWQALGVMFTPTIIFIILGCLIVFTIGFPSLSN